MFSNSQRILALLSSCLAVPFPLRAFETPLSDTAVREAYFLAIVTPATKQLRKMLADM